MPVYIDNIIEKIVYEDNIIEKIVEVEAPKRVYAPEPEVRAVRKQKVVEKQVYRHRPIRPAKEESIGTVTMRTDQLHMKEWPKRVVVEEEYEEVV